MKIYSIKRKMVFMDKVKNGDALYSIGILWNMDSENVMFTIRKLVM